MIGRATVTFVTKNVKIICMELLMAAQSDNPVS